MEINTVITVREHMNVIVLNTGQVEFVEQGERILHVHVVICNAVHEQEAGGRG